MLKIILIYLIINTILVSIGVKELTDKEAEMNLAGIVAVLLIIIFFPIAMGSYIFRRIKNKVKEK